MWCLTQFSHNLALSYSLRNGRYNLSFECRNFTNEKLYDNFSFRSLGGHSTGKCVCILVIKDS